MLSVLFSKYNIFFMDIFVAICISCCIAYTGIMIFMEAYKVLMDTNIDNKVIDKIKEIVLDINGVVNIDEITAKPTGFKFLIIIEIAVDGTMSVNESHSIAHNIRDKINNIDEIYDTIVHINPI
ncbi:ferrous iron efflux protein F [compost metagenome]